MDNGMQGKLRNIYIKKRKNEGLIRGAELQNDRRTVERSSFVIARFYNQ